MLSAHGLGYSMELSRNDVRRHLGLRAPQRTPARRNRLLRPQAPGIPYAPSPNRAGNPCVVGIQAVARRTGDQEDHQPCTTKERYRVYRFFFDSKKLIVVFALRYICSDALDDDARAFPADGWLQTGVYERRKRRRTY